MSILEATYADTVSVKERRNTKTLLAVCEGCYPRSLGALRHSASDLLQSFTRVCDCCNHCTLVCIVTGCGS